MSWTSFHYGAGGAYVYVASPYEVTDSSQVIIRPSYTVDSSLPGDFDVDILPNEPNMIRVYLPYSATGHRISIEFTEDYYTSYNELEENIIDFIKDIDNKEDLQNLNFLFFKKIDTPVSILACCFVTVIIKNLVITKI